MRRSTVVIELAGDAALPRDLAAGGVFVPGCTLQIAEECELVVCCADRRVSLPARVVYVEEHRGAGLELIGFSTAVRRQLAELVPAAADPDDDLAVPLATDDDDDQRTTRISTDARIALGGRLAAEGAALDAGDDLAAPPPAHPFAGALDLLAVPIADDSDERHRTFPVAMPSGVDDPDDDLALPIEAHDAPAGRYTSRFAAQSDPALAVAEADAAFFDVAGPDNGWFGAATADASPAAERRTGSHDAIVLDPARAERRTGSHDAIELGTARAERRTGSHDAIELDPAHAERRRTDSHDAIELDTAGLEADTGTETGDDVEAPSEDAAEEVGDTGERRGSGARAPRNVHERLRGLTLAAQLKLATSDELHERIVLERLYGKNVWETLLRNPRLTAPEVARIARYGSLPRVLLEIILANNAWLQIPEVRRALLTNPRLGTDQIVKVLRLVPKHELRLAAIQTAYPHAVRHAAKMLLRGE